MICYNILLICLCFDLLPYSESIRNQTYCCKAKESLSCQNLEEDSWSWVCKCAENNYQPIPSDSEAIEVLKLELSKVRNKSNTLCYC